MDMRQAAKGKVLQKLIDAMDEKMVGDLKGKSPKFAKVEIQSDDPNMAEKLKDKLLEGVAEDDSEDPALEMSKSDLKEDVAEGENPFGEADHGSSDDLERLLEMYKKLK